MSSIQRTLSTWAPLVLPTKTVLLSIDPTHTAGLLETLSSAAARAKTESGALNLITLSRDIRGAEASLTIILAQQATATATNSQELSFATQAIFNATLNLKSLAFEENLYKFNLNKASNSIYFAIFTSIFFYIVGMLVKSRYHWYNITFFCGYGLEFAGFLGRVLSLHSTTNINFYLLQYICLTIAPAFIMAGVYFLFAQLVVIHGRQYSVLKPMWYSYFFIASDVISLLIQAGGGGSASFASKANKDTRPGTNTMIAGICAQVFAMTIFLGFWFEFLNRVYFKNASEVQLDTPFRKRSVANYFRLLFNTKSAREYRKNELDRFYNPKFTLIRQRKLFDWFPLAMTVTVVVVYIRCVYRVVELAQGFSGFLVTHEVFLMTLDAFMIAVAGLIFIPFHPVLVFGSNNVVRLATIKKNKDEDNRDEEDELYRNSDGEKPSMGETATPDLK